ncbi:putrescine transport system permease protein [Rhizobium sp. SG_E_25_P2]|uniref:ABC transporter permease n=1 Tax=Rhizobium sp. SG_E_25_P2 TaxID=2879942 RepID=UPI002474D177|nr:ABC transporter permease [Rhizobium sp. SG_E_25_P2]MDH6265976.1 putrescine transport system permease protein [Rhizobium sp. SG_E_25_P2]
MSRNLTWFGICALIIGLVFLYIPIAVLVVYSFNDSEFVTLWTGFSFRAYISLYKNQGYWASTLTTIEVALISSVIATMLGLMIALSLSRLRHFPTRSLFSGLAIAPMVLPEVITGLALLLMFIALGIDRGLLTIVIAHVTFSMCFVTVVITARLAEFDLSVEEAARDLGAGPVAAFFLVTLPVIAPAVVTGFLLAFTISLDSLVISSFTSGPGTTTLPMRVYSEVRRGVSPEINALSTIIILVVTVVAIAVALYTRKAAMQPVDR